MPPSSAVSRLMRCWQASQTVARLSAVGSQSSGSSSRLRRRASPPRASKKPAAFMPSSETLTALVMMMASPERAFLEALGGKPVEREAGLAVVVGVAVRSDLLAHLIDELQRVLDEHRRAVGVEHLRVAREDADAGTDGGLLDVGRANAGAANFGERRRHLAAQRAQEVGAGDSRGGGRRGGGRRARWKRRERWCLIAIDRPCAFGPHWPSSVDRQARYRQPLARKLAQPAEVTPSSPTSDCLKA